MTPELEQFLNKPVEQKLETSFVNVCRRCKKPKQPGTEWVWTRKGIMDEDCYYDEFSDVVEGVKR